MNVLHIIVVTSRVIFLFAVHCILYVKQTILICI